MIPASAAVSDVLESMTDAFLALDGQDRFTYVNRQAELMIGKSRQQLLGRNIWEVFPQLAGTRIHDEYQRVARDRVPVEFEEYYAKRKAWLEVRAYPARDGMTVYYRDVTRRKQSEEAQQALVAMVSHDLRNPLFLIKGSSELLRERLDSSQPATKHLGEGLDRINRAATQMTRVVDDLVDLVQLQSGRDVVLERERMDLVALTRRVVEVHRFSTELHRIHVHTLVTGLVGEWDERRLERVLGNLLGNAIKYSPEGHDITVDLRRDERPNGSWAVVAVRDRGMGIPAA
ncbi:MAG TPA: PAS domain-containing protein, partial [Chloroflexota bacterium]|nr:PAS domain-containing protein [Chloroflexota bacterium]